MSHDHLHVNISFLLPLFLFFSVFLFLVFHLNSKWTEDGTTFATLWPLPSDLDRNYKLHGNGLF